MPTQPYRITLRRTKDPVVGNSVTFIFLRDGRPRPLADDAYACFECDCPQFEIPVFITDNKKKKFEGVLTGTADGDDVEILWSPDLSASLWGVILETTNPTVTFTERPGATNW